MSLEQRIGRLERDDVPEQPLDDEHVLDAIAREDLDDRHVAWLDAVLRPSILFNLQVMAWITRDNDQQRELLAARQSPMFAAVQILTCRADEPVPETIGHAFIRALGMPAPTRHLMREYRALYQGSDLFAMTVRWMLVAKALGPDLGSAPSCGTRPHQRHRPVP
ncbi:MAG: hypothetical protein R2702_06530 [Acidimicrobiales bacterium]